MSFLSFQHSIERQHFLTKVSSNRKANKYYMYGFDHQYFSIVTQLHFNSKSIFPIVISSWSFTYIHFYVCIEKGWIKNRNVGKHFYSCNECNVFYSVAVSLFLSIFLSITIHLSLRKINLLYFIIWGRLLFKPTFNQFTLYNHYNDEYRSSLFTKLTIWLHWN